MDPNECLSRIMDAMDAADNHAVWEGMADLSDWLSGRGFAPTMKRRDVYISVGNGDEWAYSLLSRPDRSGGGADFITYKFRKSDHYDGGGQMEEYHRAFLPPA